MRDLRRTTAANAPSDPQNLSRRLYRLTLGPRRTQVQAAYAARPRYLTVWVGANDALGAALAGDPVRVTPPAEFAREYRALLRALAPLGARTLLLTVPDVTETPLLTPGPTLWRAGIAGESCGASRARVNLLLLTPRRPLSCRAAYALTPAEAERIRATVTAYNASIRALAAEFGADVLEVQPLLRRANAHPARSLIDLQPFGADMSADGIHPSARGQRRIAHAVAAHLHRCWGLPLTRAGAAELAQAEALAGVNGGELRVRCGP